MFTSTIDGDLDPYLDAICARIGAGGDEWWGRCVGYPGRADRAAFRRVRARAPGRHRPVPVGDTRTRPCAEVREALALRERVIDFAVEAQGLDAADAAASASALGRSDARPPAERPAPRERARADIDLADIQGNVLRGYTLPAAAYLFLRIVDVDRARAR